VNTENDKMSHRGHSPATGVAATTTAECREKHDRRLHSWQTITYCGFQGRGRRRHARRNGNNYYLDWYDPSLVFIGITILLMSCLDALFTLILLNRGAYEVNFFMVRLMEISDGLFVAIKMAVTAFGIVFLLMHAHFQIFRILSGKRLLQIFMAVYGLLIGYELILLGIMRS
jgi:hypothetical protein